MLGYALFLPGSVPGTQTDLRKTCEAVLDHEDRRPPFRSDISREPLLLESLPAKPESHHLDRAGFLRAPGLGARHEVRMRESHNEDGVDRVNAAARDAMLVTCTRCHTLHPPTHPLAFHPVCTPCALDRLAR